MKKKIFLLLSIFILLTCFAVSVGAEDAAVCEHSGGVATCDTLAVCVKCGENYGDYNHTYNREITDAKYVKSPATCLERACYYKSCACGAFDENNEVDIFYYGDFGSHTGGTATCTKQAVCSRCQKSYGLLRNHNCVYEVIDDKYLSSPATCAELATYYKSCICGAPAISATFTAGKFADHAFGQQQPKEEFLIKAATCSTYALYYESCVCGLKDENNTFEFTAGGLLAHTGGTPDCTNRAICRDCNQEYGGLGHDYSAYVVSDAYFKADATCTTKTLYYVSCTICGGASNETFEDQSSNKLAHSYTNEVASDKYIKSKATCTEKAVYYTSCECGAFDPKLSGTFVAGETEPHSFTKTVEDDKYLASAATCTAKAVYYTSCECGAVSTRTFVGKSYGPHTWDEGELVTKKSLFTRGETEYTCLECGDTDVIDNIPAILDSLNDVDETLLIAGGAILFIIVFSILIAFFASIARGVRRRRRKRAMRRAMMLEMLINKKQG